MLIRVGVPSSFTRYARAARAAGAPILVSANAFWDRERQRFWLKNRDTLFGDVDVALDSAGFVAMFRYLGYPWPLDAYVDLAGQMRPTWWAAPDYCCEPEIASDRAEVLERVRRTAFKLDWANQVAADRGVSPPMPVLQGWFPDDYRRCVDMMPKPPDLVGVGSVCRRQLGGPTGVIRVVTELDRYLPTGVRLHLFGVKGSAIGQLAGHPRVASVDSMSWDFAARRERQRNGLERATVDYKTRYLSRWYNAQVTALGLFAADWSLTAPNRRGTDSDRTMNK